MGRDTLKKWNKNSDWDADLKHGEHHEKEFMKAINHPLAKIESQGSRISSRSGSEEIPSEAKTKSATFGVFRKRQNVKYFDYNVMSFKLKTFIIKD